jgi:phosphoglucomutase
LEEKKVRERVSREITVRMGRDPGELYQKITEKFGQSFYGRFESAATTDQKNQLKKLSFPQIKSKDLAREKIESVLIQIL